MGFNKAYIMKKINTKNGYQCPNCHQKFTSGEELRDHLKEKNICGMVAIEHLKKMVV